MKKIIAYFSCLLLLNNASAQTLPPVFLPAGTVLEDNTPYKLVLYDDFDGSTLDNTKWHDYDPCKGWWDWCPGKGSDNWAGARNFFDGSGVNWKSENVVISGGTCKLKLKREHNTWKCATCSMSPKIEEFSGGMLENHASLQFSTGKIEARIKMPNFRYAHSTFWTWYSTYEYINEIDIAEAYGDPYWPSRFPGDNNRMCNNSTHSWPPESPEPNPLGLVHLESKQHYPSQTWWNMVKNTYFHQDDWHTYTCEWDHNYIKMYLDGNLVSTRFKYATSTAVSGLLSPVPSPAPSPGMNGYITKGYPYNDHSRSNIRLTVGIDAAGRGLTDIFGHPLPPQEMGQMEIDYVKVWQRHPEEDGNPVVCPEVPVLSGPDIICGDEMYTISQPVPGGTFSASGIGITEFSASSVHVTSSNATYDNAVVVYNYTIPGCPTQSIAKRVDIGAPQKPNQSCVKVSKWGINMNYNLFAEHITTGSFMKWSTYNAPTSFEWNINYGPGMSLNYHAFGAFVSTPSIPYETNSSINWTLTVTNACGSNIFSGSKIFTAKTTTVDSNVDFYNAIITDSATYEQAVLDRLGQEFITDTTDTVAINTLIQRIRTEELAPYIVYDSTFVFGDTSGNNNNGKMVNTTDVENKAKIYPNPTYQNISIELGSNFSENIPAQIRIVDLYGRVLLKQTTTGKKISIDLEQLPKNIYLLEINQNNIRERHRLHKM